MSWPRFNPVIQPVHQHIHSGRAFTFSAFTASMATGGSLNLVLSTPASTPVHCFVDSDAGGDCLFGFCENPTLGTVGFLAQTQNRNRRSSQLAELEVYERPVVTSTGTVLFEKLLPGGTGFLLSAGGSGEPFAEFVLKANTKYLLRLWNLSGGTQPANLGVHFYEYDAREGTY